MQTFARRSFQLRTASFETRLAYTGFLVLIVPGLVTLLTLSAGRIGVTPAAIARYYRGGESETSFPKAFWQLVEVSHFHLFSVPVVLLILSHLLYATRVSSRTRVVLTLGTFSGAFLEALSPWAIRYWAAEFAYALLLGWLLLGGGALAMVALSLWSMWRPDRDGGPTEPANGGAAIAGPGDRS